MMKKRKKRESFAEKYGIKELFTKRLVFAAFMLPTVINLFIFSIFIKEGRPFVLGCGAALAVYFLITFAFEIKTERWTVFTLLAVGAFSILVSLFFILTYKLYAFLALLAIELLIALILTLLRNKLPRGKAADADEIKF